MEPLDPSLNGCDTALTIAGSDAVTCQNIYIRGAKEAVKSTNTNLALNCWSAAWTIA